MGKLLLNVMLKLKMVQDLMAKQRMEDFRVLLRAKMVALLQEVLIYKHFLTQTARSNIRMENITRERSKI